MAVLRADYSILQPWFNKAMGLDKVYQAEEARKKRGKGMNAFYEE